jgi:hypothetical protein
MKPINIEDLFFAFVAAVWFVSSLILLAKVARKTYVKEILTKLAKAVK